MRWPDAIDGKITLEWLEPWKVALFRSHVELFSGPAPIDGACVVHVYSRTSCEIKGMVSGGMGKDKMISGYRSVVKMMFEQGYTGVKLEIFDEQGNSRVWIDGRRQDAQKSGDQDSPQSI